MLWSWVQSRANLRLNWCLLPRVDLSWTVPESVRALPEGYLGSTKGGTVNDDPCAHCAHLSIRQAVLDWVPVIMLITDVVQWFAR